MRSLKHVLLTQGELVDYSGSETIILELAEFFESLGAKVSIFTNYIGNPIKKEFDLLKNTIVYTENEELPKAGSLDLIWVHHQIIPEKVLRSWKSAAKKPLVFFHHMSPFHPLEFPIAVRIEAAIADRVLYNSQESKDAIEPRVFENFQDKGHVFSNPAPEAFVRSKTHKTDRLRSVLVVSNHVPDEVNEAVKLLGKKKVRVTVRGVQQAGGASRILPENLAEYDAVVSIGKTVQYALLGEVPTYCYDHFGGPGYLSEKNFEVSKRLNFSGRGFGIKSPAEIANELITGYPQAIKEIKYLKKQHAEIFKLTSQLRQLIAESSANRKYEEKLLHDTDVHAYVNMGKYLQYLNKQMRQSQIDFKSMHEHAIRTNEIYTENEKKLVELVRLNDELQHGRHELESALKNVYRSASWRATQPLREINSLLKKIQQLVE